MIPPLLNTFVIAFPIISFPPPCLPSTLQTVYLFCYVHTEPDQMVFLLENLFVPIWSLLFLIELCYQSSSRLIPSVSFPPFPTSQHTHTCTHTSLGVAGHSRLCVTAALYPASEPALALCPLRRMPGLPARLQEQHNTSAELFFLPGRMNYSYPISTFSSRL